MPHSFEALLVFCEGPHDAAFVKLLLKEICGYERQSWRFSDFPYPLNALFKKSVHDYVAEDLRFDMAKKFFLPDHVLKKENKLTLIFNYGGSNRKSSVTPFLERLFALYEDGMAFSGAQHVKKFRYLFMADADEKGFEKAFRTISSDFSEISEKPWMSGEWIKVDETFGAIQKHNPNIGAYIWRHLTKDIGTLEHLIEECLEPAGELAPFLNLVDHHFSWETAHINQPTAISEQAKRLKAAISIMGQRKKPGSSLSVILDQGKLIDTPMLQNASSVKSLLHFLEILIGGITTKPATPHETEEMPHKTLPFILNMQVPT